MRNALHQLVMQRKPGFAWDEFYIHDNMARFHPSDVGHGFLAYCVVDYLTHLARHVVHSPHTAKELVEAVANERVPTIPLFRKNIRRKGTCTFGEFFHKQVISKSSGWTWLRGEKAGYITEAPGEHITLMIPDSLDDAEPSGVASMSRTGHIGVERSWKKYGKASLQCQGSCACSPLLIDLHTKTSNTTVQDVLDFPLTRTSVKTNDSCAITVKVLQDTSSGGHFVKLMSLGAD